MVALPELEPAKLTGKTKELYEKLISKRGRIDGMYRTMLHHPDLLEKVSALGTFFRFGDSVLPDEVRELVILHLAEKLQASYEWVKHAGPAREAGISEAIIQAMHQGNHPGSLSEVQAAALTTADHTLALESVPASVQEVLTTVFGMEGVLEVVALVGFYRMIAGVIFCFDVSLPPGEIEPFPENS